MHELVPEVPLRHGHAISIDMAYSATLANERKLLSDAEHKRILDLFSRAGLSMDHPQFDEDILDKGTKAILRTRDGLLRAAVPNPLGSCTFLNDVTEKELFSALKKHKEIMKNYPRNGEGLEAYVDASDTGYTLNDKPVEKKANGVNGALEKSVIKDDPANGLQNGNIADAGVAADGIGATPTQSKKLATGPEAVNGTTSGAH